MSVAFVLVTVAISSIQDLHIGSVHIAISPLLSCMMLGTIFCNICDFSEELMDRLDRWTAPIFILFFVLSGAELDLEVFTNVIIVVVGLVYIVVRCVGKYCGASLSAKLVNAPKNVKKYLGITLFPQAGVALGMAIKVTEYCAEIGSVEAMQIGVVVQNIILFSVLIYELIGPFLTKIALSKAGEINPEGKVSARTVDKTVEQK